jgi:hypothetical protein
MNNGTPTKRTFHDIVHHGFDRPRVRLFVDLTDYDSRELIQLFDGPEVLAKTMIRYAKSFGSLIDQKVMLPIETATEQQYGGLFRSVIQEIRDFIASGPQFPCIYVLVGTHPYIYNEAAEELAVKGHVVVILGKDARENAQVAQHDLIYYLSAAKLADRGEKPEVDNYDFSDFIQLMLANETRMPFVSAKYFVNKQMWRLGSQNPEVNQKIFQAARDRGIIELGKSENVEAGAMPVTTCKLNREHPAVQLVLAGAAVWEGTAAKEPAPSVPLQHRMDLSGVSLTPEEPSK